MNSCISLESVICVMTTTDFVPERMHFLLEDDGGVPLFLGCDNTD